MSHWMIYGANGYSGRLITKEALRKNLQPMLAGRNREAIEKLAATHNLASKSFGCASPEEIIPHLQDVDIVLHCAGPFSQTSRPMALACMATQTHYLDITGEIGVFEKIFANDHKFKEAGVAAIPGVGFDVVPTDCLAAQLKSEMPDANELTLYLETEARLSPGTLKTMMEGFYVGSVQRQNGNLEIPGRFLSHEIFLRGQARQAIGISWGDLTTAFRSTDIPNIQVYLITDQKSQWLFQAFNTLKLLFQSRLVQSGVQKLISRLYAGADENELENSHYRAWAVTKNRKGERKVKGLQTGNGYSFTAHSSVAAIQRLLNTAPDSGAQTPSQAFGQNFIWGIENVEPLSDSPKSVPFPEDSIPHN